VPHLATLLGCFDGPVCSVASLPVGAGLPDLITASCAPALFGIASLDDKAANVLAYLRVNEAAPLETVAAAVKQSRRAIARIMDALTGASAVTHDGELFSMSETWRYILPETVTVEAKIHDWRGALNQAARNRIFVHRSYVALPVGLAQRVRPEPALKQLGVGLLAVDDARDLHILRRAPRKQPRVWAYYYRLALCLAKHFGDTDRAFSRTTGHCTG
jgi:hypothetical protein